jgi:HD superfamily phosphodiesterase
MSNSSLVLYVEDLVRNQADAFDGGHDWNHINRVRKIALYIA